MDFHSINFVVRADAFEQDCIRILMLRELKNDAQIVTRAARPGRGEFALQLMGLELRMKGVFGEQFERELKFRGGRGMFAG